MLLTIAIPTYNRATHLERLLKTLRDELDGLGDKVGVLVSDNASTDVTSRVLDDAARGWPALAVRRNPHNIGPENNFCACLDEIDSRYFWIVGDDDLPKRGLIRKLVALLEREAPDLVYMNSEWVNPITGPTQGVPLGELDCRMLDPLEFAKRVHVWFTFISGVVVRRTPALDAPTQHSVRRYVGTSLVQLGWIFPVLIRGSRFIWIADRCVLATKDNSGGYPLLTVFGSNFARVVRESFGSNSAIGSALIRRNMTRYLPGIIWNHRGASTHAFAAESPWPAMRRELGSSPLYWTLLLPIGTFPKPLAMLVFQIWRILDRLRREIEHLSSPSWRSKRARQ